MRCVRMREVFEYLDCALSPERSAAITAHLERCSSCSSQLEDVDNLALRLAPDHEEFDDPGFADDVMKLVREDRTEELHKTNQGFFTTNRLWIASAAVFLAVSVTLLIVWTDMFSQSSQQAISPPPIQARGGSTEEASRWLSIKIFRSTDSGFERVEDSIDRNDSIAFAYVNPKQQELAFMMVFAIDAGGNVFWYYPAYDGGTGHAMSIPMERNENPVQLPEAIRHDLKPGTLKIVALFSRDYLNAPTVERIARQELTTVGSLEKLETLEIEGSATQVFSLRVTAQPVETKE